MSESFATLHSAHDNYERALASAQETDQLTPQSIVALHQLRQDYAKAVTHYHNAAMTWLSHANTTKEKTIKLARKTTAGE